MTCTRIQRAAAVLVAVAGGAGVALAQPVNNDCVNAIPLTIGVPFAGSNTGATGNDNENSCGFFDHRSIWFSFTANQGGFANVDVCGSGTATFRTTLTAYTACGGTEIACAEEVCGNKSRVSFPTTAGETYIIRFAGYSGGVGPFTMFVDESQFVPGPDVIVGDLHDMANNGNLGGIVAYSTGTVSCNIGTEAALWIASTNEHPLIGQHYYRLKDGRFEMIGQSWLKHSFATVNSGICGTCDGQLGQILGVNCSDPYGAGLNGSQSRLGPKSDVNANNGYYPYPYTIAFNQSGNAIFKRGQIAADDLNPALNAGARYFIDGHYITVDDTRIGNGMNNVGWREISIPSNYLTGRPTLLSTTRREQVAIEAWKQIDPTVELTFVDYDETHTIPMSSQSNPGMTTTLPSRFWVGAKVTDLGNGMWNYEYAVYNYNSHRSAGWVSFPVATSASVTNTGFSGVLYHSGEPYDNTDWTGGKTGGEIVFTNGTTFAQSPNANALRWGTLYNFRFVSDAAPVQGEMTLGLFRPGNTPGEPDTLNVSILVPESDVPVACPCDFNGNGTQEIGDYFAFLTDFFAQLGGPGSADFDGDGSVTVGDYFAFLGCLPDIASSTSCP